MKSTTIRSSAFIMLIAAVGSTGCYRTVANIHVDESHKLIVSKTEDAKDYDKIPSVEETDGGVQEVRVDQEKYRLVVREQTRTVSGTSGSTSAPQRTTKKIYRTKTFKSPSTLSLDSKHNLTVENAGGSQYHYSLDEIVDIDIWRRDLQKKYRGMMGWGIGLSATGALLVATGAVFTGALGGAEEPVLMGLGFSLPFLLVGLPLWFNGKRGLEKSRETSPALPEPVIAVSPKTSTYGLGLKWRL